MSDVAGAAPAAAESAPAPAPVDEQIVDVPNPIETVDPPAPKAEPAKAPTIREALDKATKTVEKQQAEGDKTKTPEKKPDPKAEPAKVERDRDETGKFAAKDKPADPAKAADAQAAKTAPDDKPAVKSAYEAPKRFSEDARKVWDTAPDPVKAEVARMEREMTAGIEKHRAKAERDDSLAEFHDMASKSGKDLKSVVSAYVGMENKLRTDFLGGLNEIASNYGVSLRDVAAHIMGQKPEEVQSQSDATIRELKQTVARLEQQIGGVSQTMQQQQQREQQNLERSTLEKIDSWAKDKPLFELLAPHIADHMREMEAPDLDEAYKAVLQKHPQLAALSSAGKKPAPEDAESSPAKLDLAEQIRKGSKSPTGAPTAGSDPATKQPSKSIRGALDKAFARTG